MCMCVGMCMYAHQSTFVYVSLLRGAISKNTRESSACGAGPEFTTKGAPCTPQAGYVSTQHPLTPFDRAKHGLPDSIARFPSQAGGPQQRHWQNFRCTRAQSMLAGQRIGRR